MKRRRVAERVALLVSWIALIIARPLLAGEPENAVWDLRPYRICVVPVNGAAPIWNAETIQRVGDDVRDRCEVEMGRVWKLQWQPVRRSASGRWTTYPATGGAERERWTAAAATAATVRGYDKTVVLVWRILDGLVWLEGRQFD